MSELRKKGKGRLIFILSTGLALAAVIGLVWVVVLREIESRRFSVEFEAARMASGLVEAFMEDPNYSQLGKSVLGFGLYAKDGSALVRHGSAPASISVEESDLPVRTVGRAGGSFLLIRAMGAGALRTPGFARNWMRPRSGFMAPPPDEITPPPPGQQRPQNPAGGQGGAAVQPGGAPSSQNPGKMDPVVAHARYVWLEYAMGPDRRKQEAELYSFAALISLALIGLYCYLLVLYRRNVQLKEQDARNRELVELGSAARTLVHEIKNPLAVIRIQTSAMRRQLPADTPPGVEHASRLIDEEVDRLSTLSDRIREFLKSGEGRPQRIDLCDFLRNYAKRYASQDGQSGAGIEIGELPSGAAVIIDSERFAEVLDNLVVNAKEAMSRCAADSLPRIELERHGSFWDISVLDRGPGIPPENVERIFEPFFTTKEKGSGIGLALARRIAEGAGGNLVYKARKGGGAVFTLSLPAA